jgi:Ca-activated chloride channel family protein
VQPPRIELIPARAAVCCDAATILDILVRITPPLPEIHILRPPINLGIVLDRSGSMGSGGKMEHAREAAIFAVWQLLPTDRVSITVFDDQIETIAPSAPVTDKPDLVARIRRIDARGSTALHGGWAAGAQQVLEHVAWQGLNRVLLLSDGLANAGLTDPGAIRGEVRGMAGREVSTSTIGVGKDYNEDLLAAMAQAGAGNYYYVETSVQLPDIFQTELQGLMATTGRHGELSVRTGPGVAVTEVLTELEREPSGQIKLPDLVSDMLISIMVRLSVAPQPQTSELCRFHLAWDPTGETARGRQELEVSLALPSVPVQEWEKRPLDPAVQEQLTLLMATKARDEFHTALQRGEIATAQAILDRIRAIVSNTPETAETRAELENLAATEELFKLGQFGSSSKMAHYLAHQRKQGRGSAPPKS